ncbi:MAG: hypothetical protein KAV87_18535 [Desulfobacteraceae bacterium]|nr:hypothetical protein [Desulfobacteraceae bacterium]
MGYKLERAHPYKEDEGHAFIASQKEGIAIFAHINKDLPIIDAESVWQYSHHVLTGLIDHRGPILTLANWSGTWPGLGGMLNLNGCLTKAGIPYSTLWGEDFSQPDFKEKINQWHTTGKIVHDISHAKPLPEVKIPAIANEIARSIADDIRINKPIRGIFDKGCMGMYNAIIQDELLFEIGFLKERLSQSALFAAMREVPDNEANDIFQWILDKGFTFNFGENEETDLTRAQVLEQCKMCIAALRIGDDFGCEAIGIQYQQGLKDLCPAFSSD